MKKLFLVTAERTVGGLVVGLRDYYVIAEHETEAGEKLAAKMKEWGATFNQGNVKLIASDYRYADKTIIL